MIVRTFEIVAWFVFLISILQISLAVVFLGGYIPMEELSKYTMASTTAEMIDKGLFYALISIVMGMMSAIYKKLEEISFNQKEKEETLKESTVVEIVEES